MKGHRKHRATGGTNEAEEDLKEKVPDRSASNNVEKEAEERKHGGRAKRKHGGKVHGEHAKHHAGRMPRKSGGRSGSDQSPFSSAKSGKSAPGHSTQESC